jgi:hypothetical protein
MEVAFNELAVGLLAIVVPTVLAVAKVLQEALISWLKTKFGFFVPDEVIRTYLNEAIQNGIKFATNKVKETDLVVTFDNKFVGLAVDYIADRVPDALKRFEITPEKLADMIKARL